MRALAFAIGLAVLAIVASAPSRAQGDLRAELSSLLDRYYAAQRAGDFDAMMAVCSAEFRDMMSGAFSSDAEKQAFLEWQKQSAPSRYEVLHMDGGAEEGAATLYLLADLRKPPSTPDGQWTDGQAEIDVTFAQEGGAWKVAMVMVGADPAAVARSDDAGYEPIEAYDTDRQVSMGGRIVRTEFNDDHTLVVVRLMDEEDFVYLPSRPELEEMGFDPGLLAPHASVEVEGHPHRSDKFKVWATGLEVM